MSLFEYGDWASCSVGSSVTWEDHTRSRRQMDLPEPPGDATPEQLQMLERFREMSFEMKSRHHATLVELHADRIVLEIATKVTGPGVEQKFTRREVIPAVPPPAEPGIQEISHWEEEDGSGSATVVKQSFDDIFKGATPTEGDETIEVAGQPLPCRWTERTTDTPMGRFQVKTWHCAKIPGGFARMSVRSEGPMEQQAVDSIVVAFDRKSP